ncbi:MAG: hypothetical protein ACFFAS_19120 [Promethearchaeota archaeon]
MKHKFLIGWALTLIVSSSVGLILIDYPLIANIMIPVEVIIASSVVPIVYIDHNLDTREFGRIKKGLFKKKGEILGRASEKILERDDSLKSKRNRYLRRESSDLLPIENDIESDVQIYVEDFKVIDTEIKLGNSVEIIKKHYDNKEVLEIIDTNDSIEEILKNLKNYDLSFFSREFLDRLDTFEWNSEEELVEFVRDMMDFSPSERLNILNEMKNN